MSEPMFRVVKPLLQFSFEEAGLSMDFNLFWKSLLLAVKRHRLKIPKTLRFYAFWSWAIALKCCK